MKLRVLAVGSLKEKPLRALGDDYLARIRRFVRCEEVELRDDRELLRRWPKDGTVVALEVTGRSMTSLALSKALEQWSCTGNGTTQFILGGAEGIPRALSSRAQIQLSLSHLTLPHRLARIVLYEQLYRCLSILRNEPYARED